jgi:hypothetical protein
MDVNCVTSLTTGRLYLGSTYTSDIEMQRDVPEGYTLTVCIRCTNDDGSSFDYNNFVIKQTANCADSLSAPDSDPPSSYSP